MRLAFGAVFSFCAGAMALWASPASASSTCAGIVNACVNDDTLWPHAGPAQFLAVGSGQTVAAGRLGFGLVTSYLSRPIVLAVASPGLGSGGSSQYAIDDQINGTFLWAYGVSPRLELDLAVPLTFGQSGTGLAPVTGGSGLKDTAVRDIRFGFAYALVRRASLAAAAESNADTAARDEWNLVARLEWSAPTGDAEQFAGEGTAVFAPSLAADARAGRWFVGAEVGARLRPTTAFLNDRIGSQLLTALGVGLDILPRSLLSATLEGWVLPTFARQEDLSTAGGAYSATLNGAHIAPAEWQLSVRSSPLPHGDLSLQVGGGGGIPLSGELPVTTPRFRFTLALRWAPR